MRTRHYPMPWEAAQRARAADLDRLLRDIEQRLSKLSSMLPSRAVSGTVARASSGTLDRVSDTLAGVLNGTADRFRRGSLPALGFDPNRVGKDALRFGHDAVRKITRETEQRPLMMLAIAAGIGAFAAAALTRR